MKASDKTFDKAYGKACSGPYVAETEALEYVMRGKTGRLWWAQVRAAAREAMAMLELAEKREER